MQSQMLSSVGAGPQGLAKTQRDVSEIRCRCLVCGAHTFARPDVRMSALCGNCHSFELEPLEQALHQGYVPRRRITGDGRPLADPSVRR